MYVLASLDIAGHLELVINYFHPDRYSYRLQLRRVDPDRPDRGAW